MKRSLALLLCLLCALQVLTACGGGNAALQAGSDAPVPPEEKTSAPEPEPEPAPEPESEPEPFVPYADEKGLPFAEFEGRDSAGSSADAGFADIKARFNLQTRNCQNTEDAVLVGEIADYSWFDPYKNLNSFELDLILTYEDYREIDGFQGGMYLFDIYTGTALPGPVPVSFTERSTDSYEWEEAVSVDGKEYPLSILLRRVDVDKYITRVIVTVEAPAEYNRLGLVVTSGSVDVTEPVDISSCIAEEDDVHYFEAVLPLREASAPAAEPETRTGAKPESFDVYADVNAIPFETFEDVQDPASGEVAQIARFSYQTRDYNDTQDITMRSYVHREYREVSADRNSFFFLVNTKLDDPSLGSSGNVYLFDVYTGIALPSPAPTDVSAGSDESYQWEQAVTVNGTEYNLEIAYNRSYVNGKSDHRFFVTAPVGYDRLGLIVTSSNVDVTEPIDISSYIAEGDNVYYFEAVAIRN